jgi:hypothetical protein
MVIAGRGAGRFSNTLVAAELPMLVKLFDLPVATHGSIRFSGADQAHQHTGPRAVDQNRIRRGW